MLLLIGLETYLPQSNKDIRELAENSKRRFSPFCNILESTEFLKVKNLIFVNSIKKQEVNEKKVKKY